MAVTSYYSLAGEQSVLKIGFGVYENLSLQTAQRDLESIYPSDNFYLSYTWMPDQVWHDGGLCDLD